MHSTNTYSHTQDRTPSPIIPPFYLFAYHTAETQGEFHHYSAISLKGRPGRACGDSTMRTTINYSGGPIANGHSNNIVEEYLSDAQDVFTEDYHAFKALTDADKQYVIQREADEHGLERPKGYTVSFHYNPHVEYHHFGSSHPMKPWRLTLTKQLVIGYGLEYTMDLYEPRPASATELAVFHDREYLEFLSQ